MRAVFSRKEPKIEAKEFCVEKVIMLPADSNAVCVRSVTDQYR